MATTTTTRQCEDVEEWEEAVESDEDGEGEEDEDLPETSGVSFNIYLFLTLLKLL